MIVPRLKAMLDGRPAASGNAAAPKSSSDNGGVEANAVPATAHALINKQGV